MNGRFFFDACVFSFGLYLFTTCVVSQIGAGNYGREVFLGFMIFALVGGWMIAYGLYRIVYAAFKRARRTSSSGYYGDPPKGEKNETGR